MKIKKLPETELELMLALWDADKSVQRNYFNTKFRQHYLDNAGKIAGKRLYYQ